MNMTAEQLAETEFPTMLRRCYDEVIEKQKSEGTTHPFINIAHVIAWFTTVYRDKWYKAHGINRKGMTKTSRKFNNFADMIIDFMEIMELNHGVTWAKYHDSIYMDDDELYNFLVQSL